MHAQALLFARRVLASLGLTAPVVVEIGSRNVNGSVRALFDDAASYIGVDVADGPGVDVQADGATFVPLAAPDLVVCMETLEHTEQAHAIVHNAGAMLRPGGHLLVTCATVPRAPHSSTDGGPLRAGEFYRNVPPTELVLWIEQAGLHVIEREVHMDRGDLYLLAVA